MAIPYSHGRASNRSKSYVAASLEGHPKDFAQERIGLVNPDAAHQVAEQHRRVPVEDDPKLLWVLD